MTKKVLLFRLKKKSGTNLDYDLIVHFSDQEDLFIPDVSSDEVADFIDEYPTAEGFSVIGVSNG